MSLNSVKNLLKQQNISWDKVQNYLKENNADQATFNQAKAIFSSLDENRDGKISGDEWARADKSIIEADTDNNGKISEEELSNSSNQNLFKPYGSDATNTFLSAMSSAASTQEQQNIQPRKPVSDNASKLGGGAMHVLKAFWMTVV